MRVTYGADYSAHELSAAELNGFTKYDLRFLMRYIGYPGNPKCISHYPGAYRELTDSGRMVLLVIENETDDPAGGYEGGVEMARRAVEDAVAVGYPDTLPIFFCSDAWLASNGTPVATAMAYLDGAASVLGRRRVGAYGFRDFIEAAKAGHHAEWLWLCGTAPDDGELAQGWPHFYQWNGGYIYPGGMEADLNWAYPGILEAVQAGQPPPADLMTSAEPPPVLVCEPVAIPHPSGPARPHPPAPVSPAGHPRPSPESQPSSPARPSPESQAAQAAATAAATEAQRHAAEAASSAATAGAHSEAAVLAASQAASPAEPSWIYGMVVLFLGLALLILVVAMIVLALRGKPISTDVVSALTLIAGGLIGILAPTPSSKGGTPRPTLRRKAKQ